MADDTTIRTATLDDGPAVSRLLTACYPALMPTAYKADILAAALPAMTQANTRLLECGTYYLAIAGAQVVGCGGWTRERPGSGDTEDKLGHIRHFGTHPDWTGRGIGSQIYTACERSARLAGISCFECYSSLNAQPFYGALGFTAVKPHQVELGPGVFFSTMLMKRCF